ncbi:OapA N-terminal domain-containing protein [Nocardia sp. BSTN01]|uniref:OapA N-terminal domain-containing protein n=1 Tax=Nocardia sp. BSTN01 TaxID=2783665 RepID=UPI0035CCFE49
MALPQRLPLWHQRGIMVAVVADETTLVHIEGDIAVPLGRGEGDIEQCGRAALPTQRLIAKQGARRI